MNRKAFLRRLGLGLIAAPLAPMAAAKVVEALPKAAPAASAEDSISQVKPPTLYKFRSHTDNYDLERGDTISITDAKWGLSDVRGQIVSIRGVQHQPGSAIARPVLPVIEFTVLLEPHFKRSSVQPASVMRSIFVNGERGNTS